MKKTLHKLKNDYLITSADLNKLVSYSDDTKLKTLMHTLTQEIEHGFVKVFLEHTIGSILIGILIVNTGHKFLSTPQIVLISIFYGIFMWRQAAAANRHIYFPSGYIAHGVLNNWFSRISGLLETKDRKTINVIQANMSQYHYNLENRMTLVASFTLIIVTTILSNESWVLIVGLLLITIVSICSLIVGGHAWKKVRTDVHERTLALKVVDKVLLKKRVLFPMIYNSINTVFLPLLVVILSNYEINSLIPQLTRLAAIAGMGWAIIDELQGFKITKDAVVTASNILDRLTKKYVINHSGFITLCKYTKPSHAVLQQSASDGSFIVKDFIPMAITNKKKITHIYNFEFKPGIYQLNGSNGIGKTTFLESLTLPENTKIELSRGELALNGNPFFNNRQTIEKHRHNYIYIGTNAAQATRFQYDFSAFSEFPTIVEYLKTSIANKHAKHSEGEKAIHLICHAYQSTITNGVKLIFIDEVVSRIFNSEKQPLRTEIIELIKSLANRQELIVIVVDHMTKLDFATQVHMTKRAIEAV